MRTFLENGAPYFRIRVAKSGFGAERILRNYGRLVAAKYENLQYTYLYMVCVYEEDPALSLDFYCTGLAMMAGEEKVNIKVVKGLPL